MNKLKNKKLLVLGGNVLSCDIVNIAKNMGLYVIVTDWNSLGDSPAKRIADEYWNISLLDYDNLVLNIKQNKVNGIITGFTDSYLLPYQHICKLTGLPCYATKEQFEWTIDKTLFKRKCLQYNVPIVPDYKIESFDKSIINKNHKIIIKPVDNSGSRGIAICDNPEDFNIKLDYSLGFSKKRQVIIERYMDCDDVSFEYKIQDGESTLTSICDRYIYKTAYEGSVTSCLIYPSKYIESYLSDVDKRVKNMFEKEGFKNGVLFMQAFAKDKEFFFYEMGYRLSGGRHYIFTKNQNEDSAVEDLINFAIKGEMSERRISNVADPCFKKVCSQLSIICKTDTISSVKGWDDIKRIPQIIDAIKMYKEGQSIGAQGTAASIFARLHIVVENYKELNDVINKVYSVLKVENASGDNLVIRLNEA